MWNKKTSMHQNDQIFSGYIHPGVDLRARENAPRSLSVQRLLIMKCAAFGGTS